MLLLRSFALCFMTSFTCESLASRVEAQTHDKNELKSFYVVTHVVSDASPFKYEYVLDVTPQGKGVLIREIRIAPHNSGCPSAVTVKAADHLLTNTTPKSVSKLDLCALKVGTVASVISGAQPKGVVASIDDTASYSIVATCGKTEKVFEIPYPETVELENLKKTNPQLALLWDLAYNVHRRSFGENFSFHNASASQEPEFQPLRAQIVPAIKSGFYNQGFHRRTHTHSLLIQYPAPAKAINPCYVEFVGPVPPDLLQYQLTKYPS